MYTRFKSANLARAYWLLCFLYNLAVVMVALAAMFFSVFSRNEFSRSRTASFFMFDTVLMFMLLEAYQRYKGSYYSMLTLFAAHRVMHAYRRLFTRKA